jgi:SH3 domain protein
MPGRMLFAIVLVGAAAHATAETAYVTDMLRLGIHRASDTSDRPFDSLVSGTELEVLERTTSYARVRTPAGQEGWVKSMFLVTEKPAKLIVAELESELAALRGEVDSARSARANAETEANRLGKEMASTTNTAEAVQETIARLETENADYEQRLERYRGALPLRWVGAALVLALVAGFLAGLWWLDALIRRRHGGFRIY